MPLVNSPWVRLRRTIPVRQGGSGRFYASLLRRHEARERAILRHQRDVYTRLLDRKLALSPEDQKTWVLKLRSLTAAGENYEAAVSVMDTLREKWPADEQTWIETLRAAVEWKDARRVEETLKAIRSHDIRWTRFGREAVSPWGVFNEN